MSYSLDPKRKCTHMVVDNFDEAGMEGVYAGSYNDCVSYLEEQGNHCTCLGMDIVPNPYFKG